jgi:septal ring factor EnvC (AmiA/AmiB activator)
MHARVTPAMLAMLALASPLAGQANSNTRQDLRQSQLRLDSIRQERTRLQQEMTQLQSRVRDASRELLNIGRQRTISMSALQELEFQATVLQAGAEQLNIELENTRAALQNRSTAMHSRLRSIYKRGPLHTVSVLLSAENFGNLLNRYKYLHMVATYERGIIDDVKRLEASLRSQEVELQENLMQLGLLRDQKEREVDDLERLEARSRQTLDQVRRTEAATASRLEKAAEDEQRLASIITRLERERLAEEREGATAGPAAISTSDLGTLNWPVEGQVVYRFGPERRPNGITLINNGIGIAAPAGTTVRAVEAGRVSHAGPFEGYGSMVMVNHGGGYYTLYMYLKSVNVREGEMISASQVIGTVGGEQTEQGAHIEFQVRAPVRGALAEPVDPLTWLRGRARS